MFKCENSFLLYVALRGKLDICKEKWKKKKKRKPRDLNDFSQIEDLTPQDPARLDFFSRMDAQWEITLEIDHQGIAQVIEIIKVTGVVALACNPGVASNCHHQGCGRSLSPLPLQPLI